ncbi:MAG: tetraacyldisaccharide 4'-kinase [Deltaproteobacteria bacterium]|nr:tetraacyldisaccharide 4'-kinase [Deltaproteobacteria bacterium]
MANIYKKIETIMRNREAVRLFSLESVLFAISKVYGGAVKLRETFYKKGIFRSRRLPCTVISVGNLTVGGTGKTPMTIYMAQLVRRLGYSVAVVSRGYKGGAEKTGGIVSNGRKIFMTPDVAGDEPFMMASRLEGVPVVVGKNRFAAGMLARNEFNPDVLVMDDAFQHLKIKRDIDLVLLDHRYPFGNRHILPRGLLREPMSALSRADAFTLTRSDAGYSDRLDEVKRIARARPVFRSMHVSRRCRVVNEKHVGSQIAESSLSNFDDALLKGRCVFVFSGIADNADFRQTIEGFGCRATGFLEFPNHHPYAEKDLDRVRRSGGDAHAEFLITTEKDYFRIAGRVQLGMALVVIGIDPVFGEDEAPFTDYIKGRLDVLCKKNIIPL